jgi:hypothetical protein
MIADFPEYQVSDFSRVRRVIYRSLPCVKKPLKPQKRSEAFRRLVLHDAEQVRWFMTEP